VSVNGVFGFDFLNSVEDYCWSDNFLCEQVNFGFRLLFATLEPIAFVSLLDEKTGLPVSLFVASFVAVRFDSLQKKNQLGKKGGRLRATARATFQR